MQRYNKLAKPPIAPDTQLTHFKNFLSSLDALAGVSTTTIESLMLPNRGVSILPKSEQQMALIEKRALDVDSKHRQAMFKHRREDGHGELLAGPAPTNSNRGHMDLRHTPTRN